MNIYKADIIYQMALSEIKNLGPVKQSKLIGLFSSARHVFEAQKKELYETGFLTKEEVLQIKNQNDFEVYRIKLKQLTDRDIHVLSFQDQRYPQRVLKIASFPILLYYRGNISILNDSCLLAVVGSRRMSDYGRDIIEQFIPRLVEKNIIIVSGMAFGVDVTSQRVCLNNGGKTISVQAQGVDKGYPMANDGIYHQIVDGGGCVVSEFAYLDGGEVEKFHFPRRNRLISGLSDAVLVVEAAEKSGALITARYAIDQNRDVYAVPGNVFQKQSEGCLELIKQGALVARSVDNILEELGFVKRVQSVQEELPFCENRINTDCLETPLEKEILCLCKTTPMTMDDIVERSHEPASFVTATITKMQLVGKLKEVEGKKFVAT